MSAAVDTTPPVHVRTAGDEDYGFIVDAWRRSYDAESTLCKFDRDVYFRLMARHIGGIMREPGAIVRIAADNKDPDTVAGFAVLTGTELHYVYVRGGKDLSLRHHGIARMLLDGLEIKTYSFRTQVGERRLKPRERGWTFAPRVASWSDGKVRVEMR